MNTRARMIEYAWRALFVGVLLLGFVSFSDGFVSFLDGYLGAHSLQGFLGVTLLMFVATVLAPLTVLPVIPMISPMLGPLLTALACWIGWTAGAVVAFVLARRGGKPLIKKFVSLDKIIEYEKKIPADAHFPLLFALRMVVPVDVLSYGLGLVSTVSLKTYTLASGAGILWFSVAFSYLGSSFQNGDTVLFLAYSVVSAIIFMGALWYVRSVTRAKNVEPKQD